VMFPNLVNRGGDVTITGSDIKSVIVYSVNGRLMDVEEYESVNEIVLSTGNLAKGAYIVIVNNKSQLRLFIQKTPLPLAGVFCFILTPLNYT